MKQKERIPHGMGILIPDEDGDYDLCDALDPKCHSSEGKKVLGDTPMKVPEEQMLACLLVVGEPPKKGFRVQENGYVHARGEEAKSWQKTVDHWMRPLVEERYAHCKVTYRATMCANARNQFKEWLWDRMETMRS